ncbi:PspC domain-containing protein [Nocardiopsis halotolerans]|uniref:PspC domain-containing protein n=1 Tax=Nocardiopsis halotolerans TaxID=124252 RepID=UPI00034D1382|nr:PspC domain-containing protein [Nocardiopsis halotolerans]
MNGNHQNKRFRRSGTDRYLAGVCGGIAEFLNVDSTLVRLVFAVLTVLGFSGVFVYVLAWLIMPAHNERHSLLEQIIRNFQGKPRQS